MLPECEGGRRDTFKCSIYYGYGEVNALVFSALQSKGYPVPEEHALLEVTRAQLCASLSFGLGVHPTV
jgi:hypothetical protein